MIARETDDTIDYTTGQVQSKTPDALFQGGAGGAGRGGGGAQVRAQFEERAAFALAPTTTYGLSARYDLGGVGQVNLLGIFQSEQSTFTRPPLGFEPSSGFIAGTSPPPALPPQLRNPFPPPLPSLHTT